MGDSSSSVLVGAVAALGCLSLVLLWLTHRASTRLRMLRATQASNTHEQQARWQATISSMPDGLMVLDAELRLLEWNERFPEYAGVPRDVLRVGMPLQEILRAQADAGEFGPVDIHDEATRRTALIRTGAATGTIERQRPNGQLLELRRSAMAGGGFITLYTDVTLRRRAEEQLRQAQKMEAIGQLTAGVAHDFKNLLTIISGNLDLANEALEQANVMRARDRLTLAQHGATRAATLTHRLVAFSRRQDLEPQAIDANRIVAGMTQLVQHSLGAIDLETVLAGGLWTALVDPNQLENALLNLAVNARDAMPDGGKITIETANAHLDEAYAEANQDVKPGQYVLIAVSDGGTGMSPAQMARAFEPFYTTKQAGKGSGLGLSQVFGFIKQSQGHVKIYSELGLGTTVKLYLPRFVPQAGMPPLPAGSRQRAGSDADVPHAKPGETVLIVEDDPDVLAYGVEALESIGYRVIASRNAAHALTALDADPAIVLLFSDLTLSGQSGQDLAQAAVLRRPDLAVLFTTGYPSNAVRHRELLDREVRVIGKPFVLAELARAARGAIDTQFMRRAR